MTKQESIFFWYLFIFSPEKDYRRLQLLYSNIQLSKKRKAKSAKRKVKYP